jgi:hypothetical protein
MIQGIPSEAGRFHVRIQVSPGGELRHEDYIIRVHSKNLAVSASEVLTNNSVTGDDIEVIRNGERRGATYYNRAPDSAPRVNYYGYNWDEEQSISTILYNPGLPEEWGGWFTSLEIEYRDALGHWKKADLLSVEPGMDFANTQWLKGAYIDHSLKIEPVTTKAIRIIGDAGGIEQDERNGGERRFYSAVSELAVYSD